MAIAGVKGLKRCLKQLSDGEVLMARGIWFQICGAAEEKAQWPNSLSFLETFRRD